MNTQSLPIPSSFGPNTPATAKTDSLGRIQATEKPQVPLQIPAGGVSRFFGPHLTPGTHTMSTNSLPTPQLSNTYTPTIASVDMFAHTPIHRPESRSNSPPKREGTLQLTWDVENQLEFALDPELLQSRGEFIELPGSFPKKKEAGILPTTMPDSILFPRTQSPTPLSMRKVPALSERSPGPRSAFPPSAFHQRISSQNMTRGPRPPSPMPGPLASPARLLPPSPVPSVRSVDLEHPRPVHPVQMKAVDDTGSIASLLADLPPPSPAASMAFEQSAPNLTSLITTPLHSAGLAVPSPFSRPGSSASLQHGSAFLQPMSVQLDCRESAGVNTVLFPTESDPPVSNRSRPVSQRGLTVGRGRPNGPTSRPSTPQYAPNCALFPPTPFLGCSPLPPVALLASLPASPVANSFQDFLHSGPPSVHAPSISSAPLTEEQRADHRAKWQALADSRAQVAPNGSPLPSHANHLAAAGDALVDPEREQNFFEKYGLFGSAAPPPRRLSSYEWFYDYDKICRSPERIPGYVSPPPGQRILCENEIKRDLGLELAVGSDCSHELREPPSMERLRRELKEESGATSAVVDESVEPNDRRKEEWFIGTLLGRIGDIHSRLTQVDMRLQRFEVALAPPESPVEPPNPHLLRRHCVRFKHSGFTDEFRLPFYTTHYRRDVLFDLMDRLGRDFWFGGGDGADTIENRYMVPLKLITFDDDFGATFQVDCRGLLQHSQPVEFVIVGEVLDFMGQMLNAVARLHSKGVYHGNVTSSGIGVYGSEMLQRQYVLHPCLRDEELPTSNGQALDMEDLGNVFMDVLEQSPIFNVFDDLVLWMTGFGKPHQISVEQALQMFNEILEKEEILQQPYMTIYRPGFDSNDVPKSKRTGFPEHRFLDRPVPSTQSSVDSAPRTVYPSSASLATAGCTDPRSPNRENTGRTSVNPIPPNSPPDLAETLVLGDAPRNEVVVVEDTSFLMSPLATETVNLPPVTRRNVATSSRKTWRKIKRWLISRW